MCRESGVNNAIIRKLEEMIAQEEQEWASYARGGDDILAAHHKSRCEAMRECRVAVLEVMHLGSKDVLAIAQPEAILPMSTLADTVSTEGEESNDRT